MNGQVNGTMTANGNGSGPQRSSPGGDDGAVVVEDVVGEAVVAEPVEAAS